MGKTSEEKKHLPFSQLSLVEGGLKGKPKNKQGLEKQQRVLTERIGILNGNLQVAKSQLGMAEGDEGGLSLEGHSRTIEVRRLKVVKNKTKPAIDPSIQPVIDLIDETIGKSKDPAIRNLAYIKTALEKLLASGGRVISSPKHTKRFLAALADNVKKFEERFGPIQ